MKMKQKTKKTLTVASVILLIALISFLIIMSIYTGLNSDRSDIESTKSEETIYVIKSYEEKIAVFHPGNKDPLFVYDFYITSLPDIDAKRIKDGIVAYNKAELQQILEDFIS
jgi:hypothetical protein